MIYLDQSDIDKIEILAGGKVVFKSLKNWRAFIRKKILKQYPITPFPYLLYSKKKKFKLLLAEKNYEYQLENIFKINQMITNLNISPKIVLKNEKFLLIEYCDGKFPSFQDKYFVEKVAIYFGKMHKINTSIEKKEKKISEIEHKKEIFKCYNLDYEKIISILYKKLPNNLNKSFTYADHNQGNYIINTNSLKLIDLGSFANSQIQDLHLLVSEMYSIIDKNLFWQKYLEINNNRFIIDNISSLQLLAYSLNFIYNQYRIEKSPFYDLRVKYHKKQNLLNLVNKIKYLCK